MQIYTCMNHIERAKYEYVCIHFYICTCTYVYMYKHLKVMQMYTCMYVNRAHKVCIYMYLCLHMYMYICIYVHTFESHAHINMRVHTSCAQDMCTHVIKFTYTHINMCIYICIIHTNMYMHVKKLCAK